MMELIVVGCRCSRRHRLHALALAGTDQTGNRDYECGDGGEVGSIHLRNQCAVVTRPNVEFTASLAPISSSPPCKYRADLTAITALVISANPWFWRLGLEHVEPCPTELPGR